MNLCSTENSSVIPVEIYISYFLSDSPTGGMDGPGYLLVLSRFGLTGEVAGSFQTLWHREP